MVLVVGTLDELRAWRGAGRTFCIAVAMADRLSALLE